MVEKNTTNSMLYFAFRPLLKVWHHISYNAYLIHSTIISHTFYNQLIYLIQKHKLRMQYLIHFLLIRKSRIISHTRKVNSTFILHILYKSEQNVDSGEVAEVENLQYYYEVKKRTLNHSVAKPQGQIVLGSRAQLG